MENRNIDQETLTDVNHILEILNERKLGYQTAAENAKDDSELKGLFEEYAQQSIGFQQELVPFTDKINPSDAGTRIQGDTWRVWMDLKSALTNGSSKAMLNASITGEEAAIRNYKEVLQHGDLNAELQKIIEGQLNKINSAYLDLKNRLNRI